jgi:hypothetical protein
MATRKQKLQTLLNTLGFDEAMRLAPGLTDDASGDSAADKAAADEAAAAKAASTNPFNAASISVSPNKLGSTATRKLGRSQSVSRRRRVSR